MILESYLLRRAVCGMTTKNYNRVFLNLTRNLRRVGYSAENLERQLADQTGDSTEWPSDDAFRVAWGSVYAYQVLNNPKIVYILKRLNEAIHRTTMEDVSVDGPLSVENIMPQQWVTNWTLPDGSKGMSFEESWNADSTDPRAVATRQRNAAVQTFGNLTVVTQVLNATASNSDWTTKKSILRDSLLPINCRLQDFDTWDESAIATRGKILFQHALKLWPHLSQNQPAIGTVTAGAKVSAAS